MATILEFRPQTRSAMGAVKASAAQILFFPGVRYQRWDDEPPSTTAKPVRLRDRIDAGDDER